ncbi:hypothetical protein [Shinella zoogloeoides]|nr:hypothetical protein [Shinella zoogloeoides]
MTMWEFHHCLQGFEEAHATEEKAAPEMADDRLSELGIEGF